MAVYKLVKQSGGFSVNIGVSIHLSKKTPDQKGKRLEGVVILTKVQPQSRCRTCKLVGRTKIFMSPVRDGPITL